MLVAPNPMRGSMHAHTMCMCVPRVQFPWHAMYNFKLILCFAHTCTPFSTAIYYTFSLVYIWCTHQYWSNQRYIIIVVVYIHMGTCMHTHCYHRCHLSCTYILTCVCVHVFIQHNRDIMWQHSCEESGNKVFLVQVQVLQVLDSIWVHFLNLSQLIWANNDLQQVWGRRYVMITTRGINGHRHTCVSVMSTQRAHVQGH